MDKKYLTKLFNVAMNTAEHSPDIKKIRDQDIELFDLHKPKITRDTSLEYFKRTRFARALLSKQRVQDFNVVSSNGNVIVTGMNGSTFTRSQDALMGVFYKELPKLISTYQNTLHGKDRIKLKYEVKYNELLITGQMIEIKIQNVFKHGQTTRWSNEYVMTFHRLSARKCDYDEYKRVFNVIAGAIEMSGLKLASKYFDPVQDNEIRFDINEEYFPSIPSIETSLINEIKNINEEIAELNARKDELTSAYNGLKKVKQLYRGGKL